MVSRAGVEAELGRGVTAYRPDLAYVQDAAFGGIAERSAPGLLELVRSAGMSSGRVVDLGCGAGVLAARLTAACYEGWESTARVLSPPMQSGALPRPASESARFSSSSCRRVASPTSPDGTTEPIRDGGRRCGSSFRRPVGRGPGGRYPETDFPGAASASAAWRAVLVARKRPGCARAARP